jgi:tRNA threonylcarbamoyladenosine biosynthesis protein TsaE
MSAEQVLQIDSEEAMMALGGTLASAMGVEHQGVVFLHGNLGAGKTTLVRGFLRSLDYEGAVKSPTYTLVESYELPGWDVYHFDLYRLSDPEELEYIGIRDFWDKPNVSLIEWPEQGAGFLPAPDIEITIEHQGEGRTVRLLGLSPQGISVISGLNIT